MNHPAPVTAALGEEAVAARVQLKGEDALFVTPTRTLVYHGEGLLSDESVEEFPHDAERVEVSEGRRKAKIRLDYGLDGVREFAVPSATLEEALHPVLAGVLNAGGVTEPGETVTRTFRFSELTLVVTSHRVVKHIGAAVWDEEYEEIRYADVTGLAVEEGNVASQLVLETTGRNQRIKVPNQEARDVRERVEEALLAAHDVATLEEFSALVAEDEEEPTLEGADSPAATTFESDLDPIELSDPEEDEPTAGAAGSAAADSAAAESATAGSAAAESPATESSGGEAAADGPTADPVLTESSVNDEGPTVEGAPSAAAGTAAEEVSDVPTGGPADAAGGDPSETAGAGPAVPSVRESAGGTTTPDGAASGVDALEDDIDGRAAADPADGFAEFETAVAEPTDVADELDALRRTVERQRDLLARQAELIEEIAAELDDR